MEEHIEHWHQVKLNKYGSLLTPGWTFHTLAIEIGCRGFVPPRFSSITRRLGFSSSDLKILRDNLQLVARKCSYVIWLNRFNKDFNSSIRISAGDPSPTDMADPDPIPQQPVPLQQQQRASRNREAALLRLRASRNRRAALLKLWKKKQPVPALSQLQPASSTTLAGGVPDAKSMTQVVVSQDNLSSAPATTLPVATASSNGWSVLKSSGLRLRNSRNNCWFHSALYLLTSVPSIRLFCLSLRATLVFLRNSCF
jgi:hypothetical protein